MATIQVHLTFAGRLESRANNSKVIIPAINTIIVMLAGQVLYTVIFVVLIERVDATLGRSPPSHYV